MNPKLESFISTKRAEHLISLGLVDKSKPINKRKDNTEVAEYEPIDITDEEFQELLKYAPIEKENYSVTIKQALDTTWGNRIEKLANFLFVLNVLAGIIGSAVMHYSRIDGAWIPLIVLTMPYCIVWYPLIVGFSKIVAFAEKILISSN